MRLLKLNFLVSMYKILKVEDIYKFKICSTVFKIIIGDLPNQSWTNLYIKVLIFIPITHETKVISELRVKLKLIILKVFFNMLALIYGKLPTDVKIAKTCFTYKKLFKDYCTGKYNS